MIAVELTKGYETVVDDIDADLVGKKWCVSHGGGSKNFRSPYACRFETISGKPTVFRLHRLILARMLGRELLSTEFVDHADRNTLNNRRDNLRLATTSQNVANHARIKNNKSGLPRGVCRIGKKYRAYIWNKRAYEYLGLFDTPDEAHAEWANRHVQLHGEFSPYASESDGNASLRDEGAA